MIQRKGFIMGLILIDPSLEILTSLIWVDPLVIWGVYFYLFYIALNNLIIVTNRFHEKARETVRIEVILDLLSPCSSGVCSIKNGHLTFSFQPFGYIFQCPIGALFADVHAICVAWIEEGVFAVCASHLSTILPKIEHFRVDADPVQISSEFSRDVSFPSSR